LRDAAGDAQPGERSRTRAERDDVDLGELDTGIAKHLIDQWQRKLRVALSNAFRLIRKQRSAASSATEQCSVAVSIARTVAAGMREPDTRRRNRRADSIEDKLVGYAHRYRSSHLCSAAAFALRPAIDIATRLFDLLAQTMRRSSGDSVCRCARFTSDLRASTRARSPLDEALSHRFALLRRHAMPQFLPLFLGHPSQHQLTLLRRQLVPDSRAFAAPACRPRRAAALRENVHVPAFALLGRHAFPQLAPLLGCQAHADCPGSASAASAARRTAPDTRAASKEARAASMASAVRQRARRTKVCEQVIMRGSWMPRWRTIENNCRDLTP
jgi:hypothetical protein